MLNTSKGLSIKIYRQARRAIGTTVRMAPHLRLALRSPRRCIVLDPFLKEVGSHNANFNQGFNEILNRRGWSVTILGNRFAQDQVIEETGAHRFFSTSYDSHYSPFFECFWSRNRNFYRELLLLRLAQFSPDNLILVHSITIFELFGLAQWYQGLPRKNRPLLVIYLQYGPSLGLHSNEVHVSSQAHMELLQMLRGEERVVICTSSKKIAHLFCQDVAPRLVPVPIAWPQAPPRKASNERIVFGYLGGARRDKGFHLLPDAIASVLNQTSNIDFFIASPSIPEFSKEFARLRSMGNRVRMSALPSPSKENYYKNFDFVDVVLIPYDTAQYEQRTSMICLEAVGMGKGVIATVGSWCAESCTDLDAAGLPMSSFSSQALAQSIVTYLRCWKGLSLKAAAAQVRVRQLHCVEAFLSAVEVL